MKINSLFLLLPVEIIRDIFSRLPVGSVLQCKLVCKNWRDLIDDHHHGSRSNIVEMGGFLLQQPLLGQRGFYYGEYDDKVTCFNLTKKPVFNHDHHCPFEDKKMTREWYIVASCNGLIWHVEHDHDMYVSNPYTREYAKLPPLPKLDVNIIIYGFGYHPTTKEYKVIRICYRDSSVVAGKAHVQVYTLGSGTPWRRRSIGEIEHKGLKFGKNNPGGILLNGVLYWLTKNMKLIISFNLENEEFGVIIPTLPPVFHGVNALGVLSGCLCLSSWVMKSLHVWVMNHNDYSWSEKFVIPLNQCSRPYFPLAYLESGKVLLHRGCDKIFSYDPETEHYVNLLKIDVFDIIPYMKSSISLKALGEKEAIQVKAEEENMNKKRKRQEGAAEAAAAAAAEENNNNNKKVIRRRLIFVRQKRIPAIQELEPYYTLMKKYNI